jgi:hypothetical protein
MSVPSMTLVAGESRAGCVLIMHKIVLIVHWPKS